MAAPGMRAIFIAVGAAAIDLFTPTFALFGLLLIWTAIQLVRHRNDDPDPDDDPLLRYARRIVPATDDMAGGRLIGRAGGRRVVTPLFLVFVAIGSIDLLFALDSIPGVFGVTQNPFVVFSANAFALLGLRALYFLIEGLLQRLVYLTLGLAVILAFIGVKLILVFLHEDVSTAIPEIPTPLSLTVILAVLAVTVSASLLRARNHSQQRAHVGALRAPGDHAKPGSSTGQAPPATRSARTGTQVPRTRRLHMIGGKPAACHRLHQVALREDVAHYAAVPIPAVQHDQRRALRGLPAVGAERADVK